MMHEVGIWDAARQLTEELSRYWNTRPHGKRTPRTESGLAAEDAFHVCCRDGQLVVVARTATVQALLRDRVPARTGPHHVRLMGASDDRLWRTGRVD